jgi:hypothetical protein
MLTRLLQWNVSRNPNAIADKNKHKKIKSRFALPQLLQEMPFLEQNVQACLDRAISFEIGKDQISDGVKIDFK